jgi:hypothetical protein
MGLTEKRLFNAFAYGVPFKTNEQTPKGDIVHQWVWVPTEDVLSPKQAAAFGAGAATTAASAQLIESANLTADEACVINDSSVINDSKTPESELVSAGPSIGNSTWCSKVERWGNWLKEDKEESTTGPSAYKLQASNRFAVNIKEGGFKNLKHRRQSCAALPASDSSAAETTPEVQFLVGDRVKIIKHGSHRGKSATVSSEKEWFGRIKVRLDDDPTGAEKSYKAHELVARRKVLKKEMKSAAKLAMLYGNVKEDVAEATPMETIMETTPAQMAVAKDREAQDAKMMAWKQTKREEEEKQTKREEEEACKAKEEKIEARPKTREQLAGMVISSMQKSTPSSATSVAAARLLVRSRFSVMRRKEAADKARKKATEDEMALIEDEMAPIIEDDLAPVEISAPVPHRVPGSALNKQMLQAMVETKTARESTAPKKGKRVGKAVDPTQLMGQQKSDSKTQEQIAKERKAYYGNGTSANLVLPE